MEAARGEIRSNQFSLLPNGGQSVAPCAINLSSGHVEKTKTKERNFSIRRGELPERNVTFDLSA